MAKRAMAINGDIPRRVVAAPTDLRGRVREAIAAYEAERGHSPNMIYLGLSERDELLKIVHAETGAAAAVVHRLTETNMTVAGLKISFVDCQSLLEVI